MKVSLSAKGKNNDSKNNKNNVEMGIFDLFRKKNCELCPFETNISDFSEAEITEWMQKVRTNPELLPPVRSDEYISSLINRLIEEENIAPLDDETKDGVWRVVLSIERGESPDVVGIEYATYQPNVAYITTAPFPFAGDAWMYNQWCMNIECDFSFLQMGASTFMQEFPGIGTIPRDAFAIRTIVPLVGADDDYNHLLTATKCLPIYGYDTRDGLHQNNIHPYAGKTGLNIQLEKLLDIYKSKSITSVVPIEKLLIGTPLDKFPEVVEPAISKLEIYKKSLNHKNIESFLGDNPAGITFAIPNYPSLWTTFTTKFYTVDSEDEVIDLLTRIGTFSHTSLQESTMPGIIFLQSWIAGQEENKLGVTYGMIGCCPNELDIKVMSWQITRFQSLLPN